MLLRASQPSMWWRISHGMTGFLSSSESEDAVIHLGCRNVDQCVKIGHSSQPYCRWSDLPFGAVIEGLHQAVVEFELYATVCMKKTGQGRLSEAGR